ncbi:MAG TPA: L,D-transpeptidase, partial [Bacteroidia bacterium]|nr:L,D-transpeptidase [Bacteroidia bacterium]
MRLSGVLSILIAVIGCGKAGLESHSAKDTAAAPPKASPVTARGTIEKKPLPRPEIHFNFLIINDSTLKIIAKNYNREKLTTILALNRINFERLQPSDSLVIPDTFFRDFNLYSPFPDYLPVVADIDKLLLFSYTIQAFAVYECGRLLRWGPVSMGKQSTPTPTGLLHTNWRARTTVSTDDSTWILNWYYNIQSQRGVSLHEYELPGYPASHA